MRQGLVRARRRESVSCTSGVANCGLGRSLLSDGTRRLIFEGIAAVQRETDRDGVGPLRDVAGGGSWFQKMQAVRRRCALEGCFEPDEVQTVLGRALCGWSGSRWVAALYSDR